MSRAVWFVAGAASGVYGLVKARRVAQAFTPDGVAARVAAWQAGARAFGSEVRAGMPERETELHAQLRPPASPARQLAAGQGRATANRDEDRNRNHLDDSHDATVDPTQERAAGTLHGHR